MKTHLNTVIIGLTILLTSLVFAHTFKNRNKGNNSINVIGLGRQDFLSDLIVWSGSFTKKSMNLKEAYTAIDKDRESVLKYLVSKGIKADKIVFSAVDIEKEFDETYDNYDKRRSVFTGYRLKQSILVESNEVDKVESTSRQVSELINSGVEFYSNNPEYYYTKLAELKIQMIAEATKDANIRAQKIAENANGDVGKLKNATMGIFQIVAQNSSEDFSWGGSFNTSSKKKTATITIKLEYEID